MFWILVAAMAFSHLLQKRWEPRRLSASTMICRNRQPSFLIPYFKSRVKMVQMNLYDLKPDSFGLFDVVIFPGVLYHLRYPFWGLKAIRDVLKVDGHLLTETAIWKGEHNNAMLFCPVGHESPYESSSCTFFNQKGLTDTLISLGLETVAIEYLELKGIRRLKDILSHFKNIIESGIKMCLLMGRRPPIKRVTRTVFHSVFRGYDKDALVTRYWDDIHHYHTEEGG